MDARKIDNVTSEDYLTMPGLPERCELINGEIIAMSPSPNRFHQDIGGEIFFQIKSYIKKHKGGCKVYMAPSDVRLDDENVVQPDIYVTCHPENFGEHFYEGAPDWVIEILSPSTASRDIGEKLILYKKSGVREYWTVNPDSEIVYVHIFGDKKAVLKAYSFTDKIPAGIYGDKDEPLEICIDDEL